MPHQNNAAFFYAEIKSGLKATIIVYFDIPNKSENCDIIGMIKTAFPEPQLMKIFKNDLAL